MSNMNNLIQWPRAQYWDKPWNPIIGCKPCSPACEHCYAASFAKRFHKSFAPHASSHERPPRKGVVFCGNMTDLFGEWRDEEKMGNDVIHVAVRGSDGNVTYLWLTKRVNNMCKSIKFARGTIRPHVFANHYFGFTAENQEWYDRRFTEFRYLPTIFKGWLSAEPLLGPIDLGLDHVYPPEAAPFSWVVVGCESGSNRRPCKIEWVESIVEQCRAARVPVFVKQLDINGKCERDITKFPEHLRIRQVPWAKEGEAR